MKRSSQPKPAVSVVIPCYNARETIEAAIRSAADQATPELPVEVIVVDDRSTDGSYELLQQLAGRYHLVLRQTPATSGPSAARNLGLEAASGAYVNFLDADDRLLSGKIARQHAYLTSHPDTSVSYTDCTVEDPRGSWRLSTKWQPASGAIYDHLLARNCLALHAALLPTTLAKHYRFDEQLRTSEDYDLWLRLAKDGHSFAFMDEPLVVYNRTHAGLSRPRAEVYLATYQLLQRHAAGLSPAAQATLDEHLAVLSRELSRCYLEAGSTTAATQWLDTAATYLPLPPRFELTRRLLRINPFLGQLAFHLGALALQLRNAMIPSKDMPE